jgi:hypothetical protein
MKDDFFPWSDLTVQHPWSNFFKKSTYKAFGPLTRCKPNVDQEGIDHAPKVDVLIFEYMPKKGSFEKKQIKFDHSLVFIFSSPKYISVLTYHNIISLSWILAFFY